MAEQKVVKQGEHYVYGDYVITPCKNVWNNQISYWLTKRNYVKAVYAFTEPAWRKLSLGEMKERFESYIPYFQMTVEHREVA